MLQNLIALEEVSPLVDFSILHLLAHWPQVVNGPRIVTHKLDGPTPLGLLHISLLQRRLLHELGKDCTDFSAFQVVVRVELPQLGLLGLPDVEHHLQLGDGADLQDLLDDGLEATVLPRGASLRLCGLDLLERAISAFYNSHVAIFIIIIRLYGPSHCYIPHVKSNL